MFLASTYKVRFLCARQFQNKIAESVYTLLKIQIKRFGLENEFKILDNSITHLRTGSEFLFYGLWRHIDEIKSLEGIDICWIEEAHGLTQNQWEVLEPTLRGEGSQFWILFNPRLVTDFVYRKFVTNTPPDTVKRKINYPENPFLSSTILKVIAAKKAEDEDDYRHIYLGEPLQDDDQAIIKRSWINAAIDAHKVLGIGLSGRKRVGFDVADSGEDKNSLVMVHGITAIRVDEWKGREDELLKSASRVHAVARIARAEVDYDSIGVGAYAGSHFKALNEEKNCNVSYFKFNAGGEVLNKDKHIDPDDTHSPLNGDFYSNVKAQAWWNVGIRFKNTFNAVTKGMKFDAADLISISSDCSHLETLIDELATPLRDFDIHGKAKVESKKDLAKRDIPSPNNADAFIMANAPRATVPRAQTTQIGGLY